MAGVECTADVERDGPAMTAQDPCQPVPVYRIAKWQPVGEHAIAVIAPIAIAIEIDGGT